MFRDILVFEETHEEIASCIVEGYKQGLNIGNGLIVSIFGISGTGKSEVAWWLGRKLYCKNYSSHHLALDRFYKIPVLEREDHRRRTDIIGSDEMAWDRINEEIEFFKTKNKTDVLIIEGLYAGYVENCNLRVYLQSSNESTYAFRKKRGKQNPDSTWRQFVLSREEQAVKKSVCTEDEIYTIA